MSLVGDGRTYVRFVLLSLVHEGGVGTDGSGGDKKDGGSRNHFNSVNEVG